MDDESWREHLPLNNNGCYRSRDPQTVMLYLFNHKQLKDRVDLSPKFVRLIMHTERAKSPMNMIEYMTLMHVEHLKRQQK